MALTYEFDTGKMVGQATITVEVKVLVFSGSVQISAERKFAGSNGDPSVPPGDGRRERDVAGVVRVLLGLRGLSVPTETFTVCALPHSCAAGADFHVSLFVSPKLTADKPVGELQTFPLFPHWGDDRQARTITVELFDQAGPIEATPLLGDVEPGASGTRPSRRTRR